MNYKKLLKSRALRLKILSLLNWVPDKIMIPLQYWIHTGRKLNLSNPKRFTEKLQLYKLNYRNPLMLRCTDKYEVRNVVEEMGCKDILIPLIGVYENVNQIDFDKLPLQFVAKTTDGGGGNQVLVCHSKNDIGAERFYSIVKEWMKAPKTKNAGREWAYENGFPRRILIENLITDNDHMYIPDFKFFCFNGEVKMIYVVNDRKLGRGAKIGIYTPQFKKLNVRRNDEFESDMVFNVPKNYDLMISIAEKLSKDFPHVRVDLYNVEGRIYFGELTFYDGSGYMSFTPDSYDEKLGSYFDI